MVVVGFDALTGYEIDREQLEAETKNAFLQRVELKKDDTHADIYFTKVC